MKTVQEVLRSLNVYKLVNTYICEYEPNFLKDDELNNIDFNNKADEPIKACATYIFHVHEKMYNLVSLFKFINSLKKLEIKTTKDMIISYTVSDYYDVIRTSLIHYDELIDKKENCELYAYEFCSHNEIMGFKLPETEFVMDNIYTIMADILYEASFFGYQSEQLTEAKEQLTSAIEEIKSGDFNTKPFNIDEVYKPDRNEEKLYLELITAKNNYNSFLQKKEINNILRLLEKENNE